MVRFSEFNLGPLQGTHLMNERFRELAEQADIVFGHYNNNEVICSAIDINKFAELIIKDQQRTWVGLTLQEASDCWTTSATKTWHNFEAALKDKNT